MNCLIRIINRIDLIWTIARLKRAIKQAKALRESFIWLHRPYESIAELTLIISGMERDLAVDLQKKTSKL